MVTMSSDKSAARRKADSNNGSHAGGSAGYHQTTGSNEDTPNHLVYRKMEQIIEKMQDEASGVPVKTVKSFMSKIPSVFTGSDLIMWMMKNLDVEDQNEALHLAHLMAAHGYFFPIDDHMLTVKNDNTFYRFQTPYFWPSNCWEPENTDYAVYLCKRTMQNKTRLELADYEAENLARLQKMFSRKWEFIFMQAEAQSKVDKKRDKLERKVLDSQERAFWDVHRPMPGCVNTTEIDIKKACRMNKPLKSSRHLHLGVAAGRLFLVLLALVGVAKASDSSWTTTYNDDGTIFISSSRGGPTAVVTLERNGARVATSFQDCVGSTANSACKKGNGIISEVSSGFTCVNNKFYTEIPVDGDSTLSVTINTTGHLYGGPEQINQYWPLDNVHFQDYSYVTKQQDNQGIADPYWLSSDGYFIFIDPKTSLFIEQNVEYDHYIKFIARNSDPYPSPAILWHEFTLCEFDDAKQAHMYAVENFLGKPSDIPDFRMIVHPVWSTWARYKVNINEEVVQEFADEIIRYGFDNSQLEIDDDWETCYGSLTFDKTKFPDMKGLTDRLKQQGYRVTLWIHPFINLDCDPYHQEAQEKGYFVKNVDGNTTSTWWNGVASAIDFTNPEAVDWWVGRLKAMQEENGIDSFKFDAGETSWLPQIPVLSGDLELQPNLYTERYVNTVAQFGDMVEVRVGHHTQEEPIFVRMLDKDSRWDIVNGLPTLITTLLEMNMVGYPNVLPDMVGGNGYNGAPSKELFIRWLEANVFMPSIQYSYVPWDYDNETVEICQKYTKLHADYAPTIIKLLKRSVIDGTPANPPIWWIDPTDETAQEISDEFLLGEDILVAPVIVEGAVTRDIYLPRGVWKDEVTPANGFIVGPVWLRDYPAPLNVLPYFTRQPYLTG